MVFSVVVLWHRMYRKIPEFLRLSKVRRRKERVGLGREVLVLW